MTPAINHFSTNQQLIEQLGSAVRNELANAVQARGHACIAVSGGDSPRLLFEFLSHQDIEWAKTTVTLVDDRWVNEQHPDSNAKLVKSLLLQHQATSANFISLYNGDPSPFIAENSVNETLQQLALPFDVVILGMGEDGHTASFFSNATTLKQALHPDNDQLCCAIAPPQAPHQRMTLTLPTILNCRRLFLHITGEKKHKVLEQAMLPLKTSVDDCDDENSSFQFINELPIRAVLHQRERKLEIYYAD